MNTEILSEILKNELGDEIFSKLENIVKMNPWQYRMLFWEEFRKIFHIITPS